MSFLENCTVKIVGPAGAGIKSSGLLFSKILLAHGFNLRDYSEYPSLVRGGHNTYQVTFSRNELYAPHYQVNLLFALSAGHWQLHSSELNKTSLVFADDSKLTLPLKEMSAQIGSSIYSNTICLGVASYVLGLNMVICRQQLQRQFGTESTNHQAFQLGYDYAQKNFSGQSIKLKLPNKITNKHHQIYDGNEAYGWGFINGGGNFYTAYPMTPASGALHFLAQKQEKYNISVYHPEDEIAAASMAAGAVFAGARAATGTSGGGFALMNETISFCGVANLGVVFYLVSRPGPATGLPTWTAQGDLLHAVHSGHGEFNKIVIAPGDQFESAKFGAISLNLAAKFNLPVIVLSDKFISESSASLPDLSKLKTKITKSSLAVPGTAGGQYLANSYEHDDQGFSIEDAPTVRKMVEKRQKQNTKIISSLPKAEYFGNADSEYLIISWGSTKSTILEALRLMPKHKYAFLHLKTLWPIDPNLELLIKPFTKIVVIENNANSQMVTLLKSQFDFHPTKILTRYDGRPFFPENLVKELSKKL